MKNEHEVNIIQEFVSLNDKNVQNCTKIMSEFYKHVESWWKKIKTREKVSDDHVHDLEKIYLKENIVKYENFVSVSCQRSDVRVTMSEFLHEFTHNNDEVVRRIILSWFVIVNDNDQIFDNQKSDL